MKISERFKSFSLSREEAFVNLTRDLFSEMAKWIVTLQNQVQEQDERIRALEEANKGNQ
jgi:hypothetical protein